MRGKGIDKWLLLLHLQLLSYRSALSALISGRTSPVFVAFGGCLARDLLLLSRQEGHGVKTEDSRKLGSGMVLLSATVNEEEELAGDLVGSSDSSCCTMLPGRIS
nr:hypothetical protein Iba_chr04bCG15150 [Ipomoea batatas]GMC84681.1 hypothetical protein Iba_chr04cCG13910 [Ipomoea batatas]